MDNVLPYTRRVLLYFHALRGTAYNRLEGDLQLLALVVNV